MKQPIRMHLHNQNYSIFLDLDYFMKYLIFQIWIAFMKQLYVFQIWATFMNQQIHTFTNLDLYRLYNFIIWEKKKQFYIFIITDLDRIYETAHHSPHTQPSVSIIFHCKFIKQWIKSDTIAFDFISDLNRFYETIHPCSYQSILLQILTDFTKQPRHTLTNTEWTDFFFFSSRFGPHLWNKYSFVSRFGLPLWNSPSSGS